MRTFGLNLIKIDHGRSKRAQREAAIMREAANSGGLRHSYDLRTADLIACAPCAASSVIICASLTHSAAISR